MLVLRPESAKTANKRGLKSQVRKAEAGEPKEPLVSDWSQVLVS